MQSFKSKLKKLLPQGILLAVISVVLVFALIHGATSFGWFTINTTVERSSVRNNVYNDRRASFAEYDAFKYDFNIGSGVKIPGTVNPDGTLHLDLIMNDYDTIFTFRNVDAPMILRFKLEGGAYRTGESLKIGMYRENPSERTSDTTVHPNSNDIYLSDVIYVVCAVIDTNTIAANATPNTIYQSAKAYFETGAGSTLPHAEFAVNPGNPANLETTVETITNSIPPTNSDLYIYFYINYDTARISAALTALGATTLTSVVPLYSDIYQFKIEDIVE